MFKFCIFLQVSRSKIQEKKWDFVVLQATYLFCNVSMRNHCSLDKLKRATISACLEVKFCFYSIVSCYFLSTAHFRNKVRCPPSTRVKFVSKFLTFYHLKEILKYILNLEKIFSSKSGKTWNVCFIIKLTLPIMVALSFQNCLTLILHINTCIWSQIYWQRLRAISRTACGIHQRNKS
jgi:hypothetical protein